MKTIKTDTISESLFNEIDAGSREKATAPELQTQNRGHVQDRDLGKTVSAANFVTVKLCDANDMHVTSFYEDY